jgi:hypothetical protein
MHNVDQSVKILYTNWEGETRWRQVKPRSIYFGATEHHPEPQWLMNAMDMESLKYKDFAMRGIQEWRQPDGT